MHGASSLKRWDEGTAKMGLRAGFLILFGVLIF